MTAMRKNLVYTCITGGYDQLIAPAVISPGWHYTCFTDDAHALTPTPPWEIVELEDLDRVKIGGAYDPVRTARRVKIVPHTLAHIGPELFNHPDHKRLWVDANLEVDCDLNKFIFRVGKNLTGKDVLFDIATLQHPVRWCIYAEGQECKVQNKDTHSVIDRHLKDYRQEGYSPNAGLVETKFLLRNHGTYCNEFMRLWFNEVRYKSRRDQLSFNYVAWRYPARIHTIPRAVFDTYFHKRKHLMAAAI
jgi:alkaline ceramidase TOD1/glycosyltransferase MUCI70-like protein